MSVVIKSRLGEIAAEAIPKASAVVQKTAHEVQAGAQLRARVDTGNMKGAIEAQPTGTLSARVTAGAEYTVYNEYGTHKMAAQPMLRPAAHEQEASFYAAMRQVFS